MVTKKFKMVVAVILFLLTGASSGILYKGTHLNHGLLSQLKK